MPYSQFQSPEQTFVEKHLPYRQAERGVQSALKAIEQARDAARDAFVSQPILRHRQNLRAVEAACIQTVQAFQNYFEQPEVQSRESVLRWITENYDSDIRHESEVANLWRVFCSWAEYEDVESCALEDFEKLLYEEGNIRVRHRGQYALVWGRAREWKAKLAEIAESTPPAMPVVGKKRSKPPAHRASRRRPKLPIAKAIA